MTTHLVPAALLVGFAAMSSSAFAGIGEETAQAMTRQYNDYSEVCPGNSPLFKCSGILLRTTTPSDAHHTWEHSPNTKSKGAVSFSYMRDDVPVYKLQGESNSGYTLELENHRPADTLSYDILCAFPTDGETENRDQQGCGDNSSTPNIEKFCHLQGVHEPMDWVNSHLATPGGLAESHHYQCAFDVSESRGAARAQTFWTAMVTMRVLRDLAPAWNELMIKTWDESQGGRLPIQSFFYVKKTYGSLARAQHDQRDFHATTGRFVPIIQIDLGKEVGQTTSFSFLPNDQVVNEPE